MRIELDFQIVDVVSYQAFDKQQRSLEENVCLLFMSAQTWRNPDQFTQQLANISSWKGHYVRRSLRHMNAGLKMHMWNEP